MMYTFIAVDLFTNWKYLICVVATCFLDPGMMTTLYTYLPDFIVQAGYCDQLTWQPLAVLGVINALARLTIGIHNKSTDVINVLFALSALLVGFPMVLLPCIYKHYWLICVGAGIFGLGKGLNMTLRGPVLAELVQREDFDRALGTAETCTGIAYIVICPLHGKLYDYQGCIHGHL